MTRSLANYISGETPALSRENVLWDSGQDVLGGIWRVKRSIAMSLMTYKASQTQVLVNLEGLLIEVHRLIQAPVIAVTVSEGL